jgi:hypothetical protein
MHTSQPSPKYLPPCTVAAPGNTRYAVILGHCNTCRCSCCGGGCCGGCPASSAPLSLCRSCNAWASTHTLGPVVEHKSSRGEGIWGTEHGGTTTGGTTNRLTQPQPMLPVLPPATDNTNGTVTAVGIPRCDKCSGPSLQTLSDGVVPSSGRSCWTCDW